MGQECWCHITSEQIDILVQKLLENGLLGDYFHFGKANFSGAILVSGRVSEHQSGSGLWRITTPKHPKTILGLRRVIWHKSTPLHLILMLSNCLLSTFWMKQFIAFPSSKSTALTWSCAPRTRLKWACSYIQKSPQILDFGVGKRPIDFYREESLARIRWSTLPDFGWCWNWSASDKSQKNECHGFFRAHQDFTFHRLPAQFIANMAQRFFDWCIQKMVIGIHWRGSAPTFLALPEDKAFEQEIDVLKILLSCLFTKRSFYRIVLYNDRYWININ